MKEGWEGVEIDLNEMQLFAAHSFSTKNLLLLNTIKLVYSASLRRLCIQTQLSALFKNCKR